MSKESNPQPLGQHWLAGQRIIVVGAGMSGLSLILSLCRQWPIANSSSTTTTKSPSIKVFERDSQHERIGGGREGYTISLRTDGGRGGGVQVLYDLGLYEKVIENSASVEGPGGFVLWDKDWNEIFRPTTGSSNEAAKPLKGMRVKRNTLQKVLADAITELSEQNGFDVNIAWGKTVVGAQQDLTNNETKAIFDDGSTLACDILIAADSSSSKVLGSIQPWNKLNFARTVCVAGTAKFDTAEDIPNSLNKDWGLNLGWNGIGIFVAPVDKRSALWSISYRSDKPRERLKQPLSEETAQNLLEEVRGLGRHAGKPLRALINATDPSTLMIVNCLDRPAFKHDLVKDGRVLFIGDANHAVSPFAGNGANMALIDGWDLAKYFLSSLSFEEAVKAYDATVIPRTMTVLTQSHRTINMAHATGWTATMYWMILKVLNLMFGKRVK